MKTIKQTITLKVSPHAVYEALMDSAKHSKFTGDKANISGTVGGRFTVWGDYIDGINLELVPDSKIVQSWHASDWPKGHYSTITYLLEKTKTGTRLAFRQVDIPDEFYDDIKQGWHDYYWIPLKKMLK